MDNKISSSVRTANQSGIMKKHRESVNLHTLNNTNINIIEDSQFELLGNNENLIIEKLLNECSLTNCYLKCRLLFASTCLTVPVWNFH